MAEAIGLGVFAAAEGDAEAFSVMEKLEKYMSDTPKEVSVPCRKSLYLLAASILFFTRMLLSARDASAYASPYCESH